MYSPCVPISSGLKAQGSMDEHRRNEVNLKEDKFEKQDPIYDDYLKEDDIVVKVEFINKLQSTRQFVFEELFFL